MNTKQFGQIIESRFVFECAKRGLTVSQPIGDNAPYDFIVDIEGKLIRVQCKSMRKRKHQYVAETHKKVGHKRSEKRSYIGLCDWFFLYNYEDDVFAYIEVEAVGTAVCFTKIEDIISVNTRQRVLEDYQSFLS